jgi:hypothetical protein
MLGFPWRINNFRLRQAAWRRNRPELSGYGGHLRPARRGEAGRSAQGQGHCAGNEQVGRHQTKIGREVSFPPDASLSAANRWRAGCS